MESQRIEDIVSTLEANSHGGKRSMTSALKKEHGLSTLEAQELVKMFTAGGAGALYSALEPEAIVQALREESLNRQRQTGLLRVCGAILLAITLLAAFLAYRRGSEFDTSAITVLVLTTSLAASFSGKHRLAVRLAATLKDKRALGPLIDCLDSEEADVPNIAIEAIVPLLPALVPEDLSTLTDAQRGLFAKIIQKKIDEPTKLAFIAAYEATCLREAIPALESIANNPIEKKVSHKLRTASQMALGNIRLGRAKKIIEEEAAQSQANLSRASGITQQDEVSGQIAPLS